MQCGAVDAVVPLLTLFAAREADPANPRCNTGDCFEDPCSSLLDTCTNAMRGDCSGEDIEKEACFILGLLAIKQDHQHAIADRGALPGLVGLLKRYVPFTGSPNAGTSVVRRAADAITNLAHENVSIKSRVRTEGGIPPLVSLLDSYDPKV